MFIVRIVVHLITIPICWNHSLTAFLLCYLLCITGSFCTIIICSRTPLCTAPHCLPPHWFLHWTACNSPHCLHCLPGFLIHCAALFWFCHTHLHACMHAAFALDPTAWFSRTATVPTLPHLRAFRTWFYVTPCFTCAFTVARTAAVVPWFLGCCTRCSFAFLLPVLCACAANAAAVIFIMILINNNNLCNNMFTQYYFNGYTPVLCSY